MVHFFIFVIISRATLPNDVFVEVGDVNDGCVSDECEVRKDEEETRCRH